MTGLKRLGAPGAAVLVLAATMLSPAQQPSSAQQQPAPQQQAGDATKKPETRMTDVQAKELFASVDTILQFASDDSKLAIKSRVKRRLTSRDAVEKYLIDKMKDDKDAKRMERSEIVLKKFGLIAQ